MVAYLLVLIAVLTRVLPHAAWLNFTAVTGGLIYFGARRPWREMLAPLAVLIATDCFLTTSVYHYSFHWQGYVTTWAWYAAAMALGSILLQQARDAGSWCRWCDPGSDFVLRRLQLRRVGERLQRLSSHPGRPFYLLRSSHSFLPQ